MTALPPTSHLSIMRRTFVVALLMAAGCGWPHRPPRPTPALPHTELAPMAAPAPTTHFALIGDFGQSGLAEEQVAALVHQWSPEFVVTLGDNNYPHGEASTLDDNVGQYYADFIKFGPRAQSRYAGQKVNRFFPCLGNHDWRAPGAKPYLDYFDLPGNGRYYTMARGLVELFIVDSDPHEPDGVEADSAQGRWLKRALTKSKAAWKIVVMHHPPYSSGSHGSSPWMHWPFSAWGADVVLSGHDHGYEHVVMKGFNYIVMGLSGGDKDQFKVACNLPGAEHDTCYDQNYGALQARATRQELTFDFITVDGRTQDTVRLSRKATSR